MTQGVDERQDFSTRLKAALRNANYSADSPTRLSREFNARFTGRPITVHAARKWLVGESIPTQAKVRVLAQWLVVPSEWLRFGDARKQEGNVVTPLSPFASTDVQLIADLQSLDPHHKAIAREFIRLLIRVKGG